MNKKPMLAALAGIMLATFSSAAHAQSGWTMGGATIDVTPVVGVPLAGYGGIDRRILPWDFFGKYKYAHYLKASKGVLDPIRAKALVVSNGMDKVLFLSLDVVGVETPFMNDLKEYAASLGIKHLMVSATHTHSGPGAISRNPFYQVLATDRFEPKIYKKFFEGVRTAITQAAALQEPVRLYRLDFDASGFSRNRRDHPENVDPMAHLMYGRNDRNEIVGGFVNYAVHSTILGEDNLKFSADYAGGIERGLTTRLRSKNVILFMNGAEGDQSPVADGGYEQIDPRGLEFADKALAAMGGSIELAPTIQERSGKFVMPKGKLRLEKCMKLPKIIHKLALGNQRWYPRDYELSHLRIGDVLLMTWPGEATTELGLEGRKLAARYGETNAWNMGLTNGYMGYFLMPHEYNEGGYESCVSYHGVNAAPALLTAHEEMLKW